MHAATIFRRTGATAGTAAAERPAPGALGAPQPGATPLVVDRVGTLVRTDLLHGTFWSAPDRFPCPQDSKQDRNDG